MGTLSEFTISEIRYLGPSIPNCCNIYSQVSSHHFPCQPRGKDRAERHMFSPQLASQTAPEAWRMSLTLSMPGGLHSLTPVLLEAQCFHKYNLISSSSTNSLPRLHSLLGSSANSGPRESYHRKKQRLHITDLAYLPHPKLTFIGVLPKPLYLQ